MPDKEILKRLLELGLLLLAPVYLGLALWLILGPVPVPVITPAIMAVVCALGAYFTFRIGLAETLTMSHAYKALLGEVPDTVRQRVTALVAGAVEQSTRQAARKAPTGNQD